MKSLKHIVSVALLAFVLLLAAPVASVAQCAMCRATVESNVKSEESKVGAGLNSGILYLMAIPYILVSTVGFIWYRSNRKHKLQQGRI